MPRSLVLFEPLLAWLERCISLPTEFGLLLLLVVGCHLLLRTDARGLRQSARRRSGEEPAPGFRLCRPKPPWVRA